MSIVGAIVCASEVILCGLFEHCMGIDVRFSTTGPLVLAKVMAEVKGKIVGCVRTVEDHRGKERDLFENYLNRS